ncbi:hypothetical protein SAMN05421823_101513 [Catalinimonas alkaloidigena]|uniref:Uncharacterized protein n=1 Tax=Catalinimonas alkaloidigena TaxID=1075417 RepID=A0A1G8XYI1_9BACT|nr:DUF6526 family protein [Catalinimonas alkaloidigena]SDJ95537.1 hypothetical protein SAMN05421823_101513 [Catalinimonas alkaloidigena]
MSDSLSRRSHWVFQFLVMPLNFALFGVTGYLLAVYQGPLQVFLLVLTALLLATILWVRLQGMEQHERLVRLELRERYQRLAGNDPAQALGQLSIQQMEILLRSPDTELLVRVEEVCMQDGASLTRRETTVQKLKS